MYHHHYRFISEQLQHPTNLSILTEFITQYQNTYEDEHLHLTHNPLGLEVHSKSALAPTERLLKLLQFNKHPFSLEPMPHHNHESCSHGHCQHHHHDVEDNHQLKAFVGLVCGTIQFFYPFATPWLVVLNALVTLYLGFETYKNAWHALKIKQIKMESLYALSTLCILLSSVIPWLPLMTEAAPLILGFYHLGMLLEETMVQHIQIQIDTIVGLPDSVKLTSDQVCSIQELKPQDVIELSEGHVIPVDGILLSDNAYLQTTRIDGAPLPRLFKTGEVVKSGMGVVKSSHPIKLEVTHDVQHSYLSLVEQNVNKAHHEKAPVELMTSSILQYFVPGLMTVALGSGIAIGSLFGPIAALQCVISVLVSACPCALSLITPLAVKIGRQKAAEQGILFKNGKDLQAAADVQDVVFDLNGTLTEGKITISGLNLIEQSLLDKVYLLEQQSQHPVARAIVQHLEQLGITHNPNLEIKELDTSHHAGIKASINQELLLIGNRDFLKANGINDIHEAEDATHFIVHNNSIKGQIQVQDKLRSDALQTVTQLQNMGKTVHLCTGADKEYAKQYAKQLNISWDNIFANAEGDNSELSKASYIQQLQRQNRKVAMVGDALNDVLAIASADIGIAVQSDIGDVFTQQQASITIQQGFLFTIATALDTAQKTKNNIYQNLVISLTYNSGITMVASGALMYWGISLNPVLGVALMIVESLIILANLYRLKNQDILKSPESSFSPF